MALGIVLGVVGGAALFEVLLGKAPAPREIRVTYQPASVPRRLAATLAEDPFSLSPAEPARGGPAERLDAPVGVPAAATGWSPVEPEPRTSVPFEPSPTGLDPVEQEVIPTVASPPRERPIMVPSLRLQPAGPTLGPRSLVAAGGPPLVGIPIEPEPDWSLAALRAAAARTAERAILDHRKSLAAVLDRPSGRADDEPDRPSSRRGDDAERQGRGADDADRPPQRRTAAGRALAANPGSASRLAGGGRSIGAAGAADPSSPGASGDGDAADPLDDTCAERRRIAEERCAIATRAREQADSARDALHATQRAYDDHHSRAARAAADADPRSMRGAKEAAQQAFRQSRAAAHGRDDVEAAAREWLSEINRINNGARDAATRARREQDAASALIPTLERLAVVADAARVSADNADAACVAAREAVAACEEGLLAPPPAELVAARSAWAGPASPAVATLADAPAAERAEGENVLAATATGAPALLRLVRGDRRAMLRLVDELAGSDADERRRWQLALAELVDAIVARSIEASMLTFPPRHPFWGAFTIPQCRDVVTGLASLGYRFDGMGGWSEERTPGQRDLSLSVGYAGIDPMRVRRWPTDAETADLFRDVSVAADEYLAETAGNLTLGELVSSLGRRADRLADVWNDWGRVRPLLLAGPGGPPGRPG